MRLPTLLLATLLPLGALAGCLDAGAPVDGASLDAGADGAADAAAGAPVTIAFAEDGETPAGGVVCPPTGCTGHYVSGAAGSFPVSFDGTLDAAELTLTWDAATPATEELMLGLAIETADGGWTWEYQTGTSPVTLSRSGLDIDASRDVYVYVNAHRCAAVVCASPPQAFQVEGTLTALAPAAAEPAADAEA